MGRNPRLQYEGALYHVRSRGNGQQNIFRDERDHHIFLEILAKVIQECGWVCHSYCLMGNHYHLLIATPRANLAQGMLTLNGRYVKFFNLRHSRNGHVLGGRYRAKLIEDDAYLLTVARYISLNPVAAFLVDNPAEWKWSSYNGYCDTSSKENLLTTEFLLAYFGSDKASATEAFRAYVMGAIEECRLKQTRPPLAKILSSDSERKQREEEICVAFLEYGYTQIEIAAFLAVDRSTIWRIIKRRADNAT